MEKKKKSIGFKKIIVSILSILFVVCAYVPSILKVNALSNVITTNNYGSFERINETFSVGGVVGFSASSVRGNLNGTYDGTVRIYITITGGATISNFSVIPDNCFIQYYSSSYIDIAFNGVSQWEVTFISTTYNAHSYINIDALTNWNMSYIGQSTDNMIKDIYTHIDNLERYTGAVNRSIIRCESLLTTIANNGGSGGSSVVTNIDANVDLAVDDLNLLKTSNNSILSTLLSFLTDSLGQVITLDTLLTSIDGAVTELQTVNTNLTALQTSINSILTAIQNIDQTIDTISWHQYDYQFTWTRDFNTFNNAVGNQLLNYSNNSVYILTDLNINNSFNLIKLKLPYNITSATIDINDINVSVIGKNGSTIRDIAGGDYYIKKNGYYIEIYLYNYDFYPKSSGTQIYVYLSTSNKNITLYEYYTSGTVSVLDSNDIEYWGLVQCFDSYNMNRKLLSAIQGISVNITQSDITEMNTNITEYNSTMTDINTIENNYINNFNTLDSNIDLSNNSTPSVNLINARTQFNSVLNDLTEDVGIRSILIFILVCGVFMVLLG